MHQGIPWVAPAASGLSRRRFLATLASGVAVTAVGQAADRNTSTEEAPLIIDCHAHVYGTDEKRYPTIDKPYRPPAGRGTLKHLFAEMDAAGVARTTAIQTSTFYRWDNRFTVAAAREHPVRLTAVCTLDPDEAASAFLLEEYVRNGGVRGMRSIPGASGRLDDPGVRRLWDTAERLGIVINALVNRDQRPHIEALVESHPKLRVVIDHCLNLTAGPQMKATLADMLALARFPTIHAKLTFLPTGSAEEYPCRDLHEPCRAIIEAFGPERCVWGSDFPCELWCPKVTYAQHLRIFTHELGLSAHAQKHILGATAQRLWFGERKSSSGV